MTTVNGVAAQRRGDDRMDDKAPAFLVYPNDFFSDENVELMNNAEVGCYWRLLCKEWTEGSIPADIGKIAKLCKEDGSAMTQLWTAISPCFVDAPGKPGRLVNRRMEEERRKMLDKRQERSSSGTKGARARWDKDSSDTERHDSANGSAMKEPNANDSIASSISSSSINAEEEAEKTACLAYLKEKFPNWTLAGDKYRSFLEWSDKFPWSVIKMAAEETMAAGVPRLSYCEGILRDWDEAGCYTSEAVMVKQVQKRAARGDTRQPTKAPIPPPKTGPVDETARRLLEMEGNSHAGV